jgi:rhamnosyl/mannosyltransferase
VKVLQIGKFYPPRWGGMETAVKDICETLAGRVDLDVVVANEDRRRILEPKSGFRVLRLPNWRTVFSQPITPGLLPVLQRDRADIVHLHEPNPLALACFLASRHRGRLIIHYHSDIVRQRFLGALYRPLLELGFSRADAIVTGSQELITNSRLLSRWKHKCVVIPFGIDLAPFLGIDAGQRRQRTSSPVILAVGRLSYYKGFQYLIDAAREVDCRIVIAGQGELKEALQRQIRDRRLTDRVTLAGKVTFPELLGLYEDADIFCLPSCERSEAFGLAMVEAMGAALPVVSTDLPTGVRAVNRDGETGIVVTPGDSRALAEALSRLAVNRQMRWDMGDAGRRRAEEFFTRERMGQSILGLYNAVNAGHTAS